MRDKVILKLVELTRKHYSSDDFCNIKTLHRYADLRSNRELAYGFGKDNPYAFADFLNINFSLPLELKFEKEIINSFIVGLQELQDERDGFFYESSHHYIHTTANAVAALARYGEKSKYKIRGLDKYICWNNFEHILNSLRWTENPWRDSNIPSGIITCLYLTKNNETTKLLFDEFFNWLEKNCDETKGLWLKDNITSHSEKGIFPYIACAFHFLFLYPFFKRRFSYPLQLMESCKSFYNSKTAIKFNKEPGFLEIDWLYCYSRSAEQLGNITEKDLELLISFENKYIDGLNIWLDTTTSSDLHKLAGAFSTLAEFERLLNKYNKYKIQLNQILDHQPFI